MHKTILKNCQNNLGIIKELCHYVIVCCQWPLLFVILATHSLGVGYFQIIVVSHVAVRSAASSYAAMHMVAGSRPILVIV